MAALWQSVSTATQIASYVVRCNPMLNALPQPMANMVVVVVVVLVDPMHAITS